MTTVLNCPFCGDDDPEIDEVSPGVCVVRCIECGCLGPHDLDTDGTPEQAVEAWNRRGSARPDFLSQALNEGDGVYRP